MENFGKREERGLVRACDERFSAASPLDVYWCLVGVQANIRDPMSL